MKTLKNGDFCGELLSENYFEAVLAAFFCSDYGAKASEAVQKIATDQKEYRKYSSYVIICWKLPSLSFCEIWRNPTPSLFFNRLPYKEALQDIEFYDKFVDISKVKNPAVSKVKV